MCQAATTRMRVAPCARRGIEGRCRALPARCGHVAETKAEARGPSVVVYAIPACCASVLAGYGRDYLAQFSSPNSSTLSAQWLPPRWAQYGLESGEEGRRALSN